jgi:stringent starvation protein B
MTSNRPYLLRAFFDWIVDNECTPHLVVNADFPAVQVPTQFVQDGQIVLNISPIYARENGEGTVFTADEFLEDEDDFAPELESVDSSPEIVDETPDPKPEKKKGSHLRVIK